MSQILRHTVHATKKHPFHAGFLVLLLLFTVSVVTLLSIPRDVLAVAPINTSPPSVSGIAAVGQVISVDEGIWTGLPTYTYQWRSCDSAGNNCADITGAISSTYTLQAPDAGNTVRVVVAATNIDGSDSATSNASQIVQAQLGDLNSDGIINLFDLGILVGSWLSSSSPSEDLDASGQVNQADLNILLGLYQP